MEFVKSARKHGSLFSETIYVLLNITLAILALYLVDLFSGVPVLAYLLIALSKWRVFAVRPRFWFDNLQSNVLDLLLGLSVVTLLSETRQIFIAQLIIVLLYIGWLIGLKPRTKRLAVLSQAVVAQFFAITALYSVAISWPSWAVAASMWLIGYVTVRHALTPFEERDTTLFSLIWGLVVAEIGWLAYHWTIAYAVVGTQQMIKIPQVAVVISLLGYFVFQLYNTYYDKKSFKKGDIIWPAVFVGAILLVIFIFFNGVDPNNPA